MKEIWKDIDGFEGGYQVSNKGRVYSVKSNKFLKPTISTNGYLQVCLYKSGVPRIFRLHRIIAVAFIDNPENKPTVNHINGIKTANQLANLEWSTVSENTKHAFDSGLHIPHNCQGVKNGRAKLSEIDVAAIISLLPYKTNTEIAPLFNVKRETISGIRTKRLWRHLQS